MGAAAPEVDGTGLDFRVVHARDEAGQAWVLRTPRRPEVVESARVEARVLRLLQPRMPVAVPDWRVHALDLIAYPRLAGTPAVTIGAEGPIWNMNEKAPPERFLASMAESLAALQAVPVDAVRNAGVPVRDLAESRATLRKAMEETREVLQPTDALWARWHRWLDSEEGWPPHLALVHGDLHPGHMLLDGEGAVTGILDWTEAQVTDPSIDLAMFHGCFGPESLARLIALFERAGGRTWPGLPHHAAERWASFPALGAQWGLRTGNQAVIAHTKSMLAPE